MSETLAMKYLRGGHWSWLANNYCLLHCGIAYCFSFGIQIQFRVGGTAFAYGQTSSGKTFTMNGSESDPGIILLAIRDIFQNIEMTSDREFFIRVSYMEIYNEEINDLFAPENHKLQIHESLERGIFVAGLREEIVNNAELLPCSRL